ncbi:MAG: sugar ABC transporter ATP-binding protein [Bauldia sp.]|nr:sugar ABC transporter ATP-binding protein [Bauldia sp.]
MDAAIAADPGAGQDPVPVLRIAGLSKHFGGAQALANVGLTVARGEVHGLLGQNGSGKSTLIKVLSGFHEPDPGAQLWVNGVEVALPIPPGAFRSLGISFVHQHLALVPSLTVLENLMIGDLAVEGRWRLDWRGETARARDLFARYGLAIDPRMPVERLSSVQRALLAIVRAFDQLRRSRAPAPLLILDEPTPFLPASDVEHLFALIRTIVAEGASVIFVSHDIDEVRAITDRATVLRDGRVAGTVVTREVGKDDIVRLIVGRVVDLEAMRPPRRSLGTPTITIAGLSGGIVDDFSLSLATGEVVGLTGLIGSGYDSVIGMIYGAEETRRGTLAIDGAIHDLAAMTPARAIALGAVFVPGDRSRGAIPTLAVRDNISLPVLGRGLAGLAVNHRRLARRADGIGERYDIRPRDTGLPLGSLSGGNQQKAVLAKWFEVAPRLILLDEPTQGVDIGAREQVFNIIRAMCEKGAAVICASSDYEQLAALSDRVVVFSRGRVAVTLRGDAISKSAIAESCYRSAEPGMAETAA